MDFDTVWYSKSTLNVVFEKYMYSVGANVSATAGMELMLRLNGNLRLYKVYGLVREDRMQRIILRKYFMSGIDYKRGQRITYEGRRNFHSA
jgi:hypothetical protein